MRRGYSISSIAIIAVVGVAVLAAWMNYQSTAGVKSMERIADDQSILKANMETVKSISGPTLKHAANAAALSVAGAGGGMTTEKIWFCDGITTPPTLHEVIYSLSNKTLNNLNTFLDDSTDIFKELDVYVEQYKCAELYPETGDFCPKQNYPVSCDGWNLTATGGSISSQQEDTSEHKYIGDINSYVDDDRFFWMYYRLIEAETDNSILKDVQVKFADEVQCDPGQITNCDNASDPQCCCLVPGNLSAVFNSVTPDLKAFKGFFDDYVVAKDGTKNACTVEKECMNTHSVSVKITCIDTKYKIPGGYSETGESYLTWVLMEKLTVGCELNGCTLGAASAPGPVGEPKVSMAGNRIDIQGDLDFAGSTGCTQSEVCFDKKGLEDCRKQFQQKLCYSP